MNFEIYTSLSNKLDVKEYMYDASESGADGTFNFGLLVINNNTITKSGEIPVSYTHLDVYKRQL